MKYTVQEHQFGAVYGKTVIRIEATPEELAELRLALATVDKFKSVALRAAKAKEGRNGADWTMVGYGVKTDCVIVTVEQGACG